MEKYPIRHRYDLIVPASFRLDFTSAIVRRHAPARDIVEWRDGTFLCAFPGRDEPIIVALSQPEARRLNVVLSAAGGMDDDVLTDVEMMLGLGYDESTLRERIAHVGWLRELGERFAGAWPACTPTVWEAAVTAIVFQSVSMLAAAAVLDRIVARFGRRLIDPRGVIAVFPTPAAIAEADDASFGATGLSRAKVAALRALAVTVVSADWDVRELRRLSTPALCEKLATARGIGPWSAAVIALRGLGRLDVFPARDSGVLRTIERLSSGTPNALADALCALGDRGGMLYHLLLLARLDDRGLLDRTPLK